MSTFVAKTQSTRELYDKTIKLRNPTEGKTSWEIHKLVFIINLPKHEKTGEVYESKSSPLCLLGNGEA